MQHADALFYPEPLLDVERLRGHARATVCSSSLIRRASVGEHRAARQLHRGFWPFVREFERAIDHHPFPTRLLITRFGTATRHKLRTLASEVRAMRDEEGVHSTHWREDALSLGVADLEGLPVPGVAELIRRGNDRDHPRFFAVLAGTELIAEELGAFLVPSTAFTQLFDRGRWIWGEIHIAPHGDRPSHLDIDLDLARATAPNPLDVRLLERQVWETIDLFNRAAEDVEHILDHVRALSG